MGTSKEQKRLEANRANKRAIADEASKSKNSSTCNEGARKAQEAKGKDPGTSRS